MQRKNSIKEKDGKEYLEETITVDYPEEYYTYQDKKIGDAISKLTLEHNEVKDKLKLFKKHIV